MYRDLKVNCLAENPFDDLSSSGHLDELKSRISQNDAGRESCTNGSTVAQPVLFSSFAQGVCSCMLSSRDISQNYRSIRQFMRQPIPTGARVKKAIYALTCAVAMMATTQAHAWKQETHRRIVLDAVNYMKAHPNETNYTKLLNGVTRAGYTIDQFAAAMGQGAYDVDDFADTYICGVITGDCEMAPVWGLAQGIVKYTSYWHFQNHTAGRDVHGNPFGGYNHATLTVAGDVDNLANAWLYGDHLDDGPGGMKGWFGDGTKYNSYGITEAHYRFNGYSTPSQYSAFQTMAFQPIDNLGQYWFQQFLSAPTAQSLGFALHTTDLLQPHHTWATSANNHVGWEQWVLDNYDTYNMSNPALVQSAMADFTPLAPNAVDIRGLLTQGGSYSYANGGIVLSSTDDKDRIAVAQKVIPHSIAMVVHILNRAAERLSN